MRNLLNLGKVLNKKEQQVIFGGNEPNRLTRKPQDGSCMDDNECQGVSINGQWHEGICEVTAGGLGVCVIQN